MQEKLQTKVKFYSTIVAYATDNTLPEHLSPLPVFSGVSVSL